MTPTNFVMPAELHNAIVAAAYRHRGYTAEESDAAARARFPGEYRRLPQGVALPGEPRDAGRRFVLEWRADESARARAALRILRDLPDWELVLLRTQPLARKPYVPLAVRGRVHVRTALEPEARLGALAGAAALIPAQRGLARLALEAQGAAPRSTRLRVPAGARRGGDGPPGRQPGLAREHCLAGA